MSHRSFYIQALTAIVLAISLFFVGCAAKIKPPPQTAQNGSLTTNKLLDSARSAAYSSMKQTNRKEAKELAEKGIGYAEQCLMHAPENAGCHYWRAVNTGLFYKIRVVGYQRGIKQMIEDCKSVIAVNPKYDNAGAYRILGRIYTKLPQTGAHTESVTRDLTLAEEYLSKATQLAPDYPENYLALADTFVGQGKIQEAISALASAKELAPHWKGDISYDDWKMEMRKLEKKIAKKSTRSTSGD